MQPVYVGDVVEAVMVALGVRGAPVLREDIADQKEGPTGRVATRTISSPGNPATAKRPRPCWPRPTSSPKR